MQVPSENGPTFLRLHTKRVVVSVFHHDIQSTKIMKIGITESTTLFPGLFGCTIIQDWPRTTGIHIHVHVHMLTNFNTVATVLFHVEQK